MKYLHLFEDLPEYTDYVESEYYEEPFVSLTEKDASGNTINKIDYNKPPHDYSQDNFTIEVLSNGNISFPGLYGWDENDEQFTLTMECKKNGGEWFEINSGSTISVVNGDELEFRSDLTFFMYGDDEHSIFSDTNVDFNVKGNIMSLVSVSLNNYNFVGAFNGCTGLISAEHLVLPTVLPRGTFQHMFYNCTSLTIAPSILPMTTLVDYCYSGMFEGCTSLTTAPELPATTLATECYNGMFNGCTSLTTAPELPATSLTYNCYGNMFRDCTSLTEAPELPATTLATECYNGMFNGCTSLTTAPELPATTLAEGCYYYMFSYCTSLNYIKCLATNISAEECTTSWVDGVSSTGTFVKNPNMNNWQTGSSGIPNGWTVEDA